MRISRFACIGVVRYCVEFFVLSRALWVATAGRASLRTGAICKLLHGLPDAPIEKVDERELLFCDRVIATPRFSLDERSARWPTATAAGSGGRNEPLFRGTAYGA